MSDLLTYEAFSVAYRAAWRNLLKYRPGEIGALIFCERMAVLGDENPAHLERFEMEETD